MKKFHRLIQDYLVDFSSDYTALQKQVDILDGKLAVLADSRIEQERMPKTDHHNYAY